MFNKTRLNIVVTVVVSLLALLAVTLVTIYISNRIAIQRENEEMLRTYVERYSPDEKTEGPGDYGQPYGDKGDKPDMLPEQPGHIDERHGNIEPQFQLSTFYSVAFSPSGEVLKVSNGNTVLHNEDELLDKAQKILNGGKTSGRDGNVTYLVEKRADYTLVAMIDSTISESNQALLIRQMLIIGSIALIILFVISIFISRAIVRPLEENDKRQKRFISDAGHELKTPIAVISANSELLKREIGENEWLDNIDYENERMSDLVKQLLILSKAERGEIPKETLDLSKLVSGEVLPFETLAFEKGKQITSEIEPGLFAQGNPGQLRQLVSILLDNALSHGIGTEIELSLRKEHHSAVLTVSNDAKELGSEQLSHLFDRFYRADEARSGSDSHYGLGLSIAHAVTEAHGGMIHAEYKDGKAFFTVSLPIKRN